MKKYIIVVLSLAVLAAFSACSKKQDEPNVSDTAAENLSEEMVVSTPYVNLTVPGSFDGNVKTDVVSDDPYVISFSANDGTWLFSLCFGKKTENLIGTLVLEDQNVIIYADFAELDSENPNYVKYCEYADGINTIISHLIDDNGLIVNQAIETEDNSTFDIETPITVMKYPAKWQDKVEISVSEEGVKFSASGVPLFDLVFAEGDGFLLGTYNGTPIYIVDYPVETEEMLAMQEDVNVILQYLIEDSNFKINY